MRAVEKYLEAAIKIFDNDLALPPKERKFFSERGKAFKTYNGYIASFGSMVLQSGLLPATVVFSAENDNSDKDRRPIVKAIFQLLKNKQLSGLDKPADAQKLLDWVKAKRNDHALRQEVMNASIALKLAFRTFEFEKDNPQKTPANG